jgi:hypothetical protein
MLALTGQRRRILFCNLDSASAILPAATAGADLIFTRR